MVWWQNEKNGFERNAAEANKNMERNAISTKKVQHYYFMCHRCSLLILFSFIKAMRAIDVERGTWVEEVKRLRSRAELAERKKEIKHRLLTRKFEREQV